MICIHLFQWICGILIRVHNSFNLEYSTIEWKEVTIEVSKGCLFLLVRDSDSICPFVSLYLMGWWYLFSRRHGLEVWCESSSVVFVLRSNLIRTGLVDNSEITSQDSTTPNKLMADCVWFCLKIKFVTKNIILYNFLQLQQKRTKK